MKFIFILLVCITHVAYAQTDEQQIEKVLYDQTMAWNQGDLIGYMEGYWKSDSLIFIGSKGVRNGWRNTLESYQISYNTPERMGRLEFSNLKFERLCNSEFMVLGRWSIDRTGQKLRGYFTLRTRKINGQWKIIFDHSS